MPILRPAIAACALLLTLTAVACGTPEWRASENRVAFFVGGQNGLPRCEVVGTRTHEGGDVPRGLTDYSYFVVVPGRPTHEQLRQLAVELVAHARKADHVAAAWSYFYDYAVVARALGSPGPSLATGHYSRATGSTVPQSDALAGGQLRMQYYDPDWSRQPTEAQAEIYVKWLAMVDALTPPEESPFPAEVDRRWAQKEGISMSTLVRAVEGCWRWYTYTVS